MITPTTVTPTFSVSPQIQPEDVAELARLGYRTLICNRPDGEDAGQPSAAAVEAAAVAAGLAFVHIPVVSETLTLDRIAAFRKAFGEEKGPVLAYCRSGTRSYLLWAICQLTGQTEVNVRSIVADAADRGYDIGSAPLIAQHLQRAA